MTLHLHRAVRSDLLAARLGTLLADPLADAFGTEVVAVPTRGVERWLTQQLSHVLGAGTTQESDGVCAGIEFPSPRRVVTDAVTLAGGTEPAADPWRPGRLLWAVLDAVVDAGPEAILVGSGADLGDGRAMAVARRVTELFDGYAWGRPAMLAEWADGRDTDGAGGALPEGAEWQPELWRRLRQRFGPSPAERLDDACRRLRNEPGLLALPERVSVFGATRLSRGELAVLAALAARRDVHLWLPHPSPVLWDEMLAVAAGERAGAGAPPVRRADDPAAARVHNTLLASLGRDSRELPLLLVETVAGSGSGAANGAGAAPVDEVLPAPPTAPGLLGVLQDSLTHDRPLGGTTPVVVGPEDDSLSVHACHGPDRQVEVLREIVLGLLAADPALEPRDVIVMCPDIERYAPLLAAAFGAVEPGQEADAHPGHRMSIKLADRSLRSTNPVLEVLTTVLDLVDGRVTASAGLDLLGTAPVRTRFRMSDDDLERAAQLVGTSGVRWGLDAADRSRSGMGSYVGGTWTTGLDRILTGVAMGEDGQWTLDTAVGMSMVESSLVGVAGRLAEFARRLGIVLEGLRHRQSLAGWLRALRAAITELTDCRSDETWQQGQATRILDELAVDAGLRPDTDDRDDSNSSDNETAGTAGAEAPELDLADIRVLLDDRLRGRPTRANFRTGSLTACTLSPMRSVPHPVVCLLGMDDGAFPRTVRASGDDVVAAHPLRGDRDVRSEDRQQLLDAVLAATRHLVVVYGGADPRTNEERPPAVPVGELLDAVDQLAVTADGRPAGTGRVLRHPLQPFDPANFETGRLGAGTSPFSFDRAALLGAQALGTAGPSGPWLAGLSAAARSDRVELPALRTFFDRPYAALLRDRLGLRLADDSDEPDDRVRVELDGLGEWAIGQRQLELVRDGVDPVRARDAEARRGSLPAGAFGLRLLDKVSRGAGAVAALADDHLSGTPRSLDLDVVVRTVPDQVAAALGRATSIEPRDVRVTGTVNDVYGYQLATVTYSSAGGLNRRMTAWLSLLVATVSEPGQPWQSVVVGRYGKQGTCVTLGPVPVGIATEALARLVTVREFGLDGVLPLFPDASATYARRRLRSTRATSFSSAAREFEKFERFGEQAEYTRVFGTGVDRLAGVIGLSTGRGPMNADGPLGADPDPDPDAEPTAFGRLARLVYGPLAEFEEADA